MWLAAETSLPHVIAHLDQVRPDVAVIDSIQAVHDPELGSAPGTVGQVRDCAQRLVAEAKARGVAVVLVGHVTKDGAFAGPRVLEHVVDTVLAFEGDRHHALRLLRAVKHRFGSTAELGLFEMADAGLLAVPDPSALFLADRRAEAAGSSVVPMMEGHRPLMVEVQALVAKSTMPQPRRSAQGVDSGRLALLLAVLDKRAELGTGTCDVFALAVGGVKVTEPAADLALCLAIASSASGAMSRFPTISCRLRRGRPRRRAAPGGPARAAPGRGRAARLRSGDPSVLCPGAAGWPRGAAGRHGGGGPRPRPRRGSGTHRHDGQRGRRGPPQGLLDARCAPRLRP